MAEPVRYRVDDGIATVSIVTPDRRNVLTPDVVAGLEEALSAAEDARCLLLRGEGGVFCAGGDLAGLAGHANGDLSETALLERLEAIDDLIERLHAFPVPTLAAVEGAAFGTGGALVLACDLAVASADAGIGFGFGRLGLAPAGGTSFLLPQAVGPSTARELCFTGELIDAARGAKLGLFDRVYPSEEFTVGVASLLDAVLTSEMQPTREAKHLLAAERDGDSLRAAMAAERAVQRRLLGTKAHEKRVQAFLDGGQE